MTDSATRSQIGAITDEYNERLELILERFRLSERTQDRIRAAAVDDLEALLKDTLEDV